MNIAMLTKIVMKSTETQFLRSRGLLGTKSMPNCEMLNITDTTGMLVVYHNQPTHMESPLALRQTYLLHVFRICAYAL